MVSLRNDFTVTTGKQPPAGGEILCSVAAESLVKCKVRVFSHQPRLTHFTGTLLPSSTPARGYVAELGRWAEVGWNDMGECVHG